MESQLQTEVKEPLAGADLESACKAMERPRFLHRLAACIAVLARQWGFFSPFGTEMDLPGGKTAGDLAVDIVEKTLDGSYKWDSKKEPDFYEFCRSRAKSILSNWLSKHRRVETMAPIATEDSGTGEMIENVVSGCPDPTDPYSILKDRDGGRLGDSFIADFALGLPDGSPEQSIMMAILDDRECGNRAYCMRTLQMTENVYDAASKRIFRQLPKFQEEWFKANGINNSDWKGAK